MLKDDLEFFRIIYRFFADADKLMWASIGVAAFVGFLYFRFFFPKRDGFDDLPEDDYQWFKTKLYAFILLAVGAGALAYYYQLPDWFSRAFK